MTFQYDDVDYIYSLATKVPSTGWVVSGENIGIRVFQDQTVIQNKKIKLNYFTSKIDVLTFFCKGN